MPLLRNGELDDKPWRAQEAGAAPTAYRYVALADYAEQAAAWQALEQPWFAVVGPDDDLQTLPAELLAAEALGVDFPQFTDGRGYSQARLLRQHLGYRGELIATGDVRRDQIDFMARVGIETFVCAADIDLESWRKALHELRVGAVA